MSKVEKPPGHQLAYWNLYTSLGGTRVYVIRAKGLTPVKVGIARNVRHRMAALQTGNPYELEILHAIPGDQALETSLHREMADDRLVGEWFDGPTVQPTIQWICDLGEWLKEGLESTRRNGRGGFLRDWREFGPAHLRINGRIVRVDRSPAKLPPFRSDEELVRERMRMGLSRNRAMRYCPSNPEADKLPLHPDWA